MRGRHERGVDAVELGVQAQVLRGRQVAVERRVLEDEADVAADVVALADDVVAGDVGAAAGRLGERAEHVDRRRLAGAVGAEEAEDLAAGDVEADAAHGLDLAEGLSEVLDVDRELCHIVAVPSAMPGRRDDWRRVNRAALGRLGTRARRGLGRLLQPERQQRGGDEGGDDGHRHEHEEGAVSVQGRRWSGRCLNHDQRDQRARCLHQDANDVGACRDAGSVARAASVEPSSLSCDALEPTTRPQMADIARAAHRPDVGGEGRCT